MRKQEEARQVQRAPEAQIRPPRWTIGLLGLLGEFWKRGVAVTREQDVNVIGFACGELQSPHGFDAQANLLGELAGAQNVDGLVVWSDYIGHYIDAQEMHAFVQRFAPLPVVSIGPVEGVPCVLVDNYQGVYEEVSHLIEVHGYERIACIRGPEGNVEADQRYAGYVEALSNHGMRLRPELVVTGGFSGASAADSLWTLLDEREVTFDALVAPTDEVAMSVIDLLQTRNIMVPDDIAVVGFDDEAADFTPPLTSVHAQWYEASNRSVEMLLAILNGEAVPEEVVLPSSLVVRESCGCAPQLLKEVASSPAQTADFADWEQWLAEQHDAIITEMRDSLTEMLSAEDLTLVPLSFMRREDINVMTDDDSQTSFADMARLLDAFVADLRAPEREQQALGEFVSTLQYLLREHVLAGRLVLAWHQVIAVLRRYFLSHLDDVSDIIRAENLWQQATVLIGETERRAQSRLRAQALGQMNRLQSFGHRLVMAEDFDDMGQMLNGVLTDFKIPHAYVALYDDPHAPLQRAHLAYQLEIENGKSALPAEMAVSYPAPQLLPTPFWEDDRRYELRVEPLFFRKNQIGFGVFEGGPLDRGLYETLKGHISTAIWKIVLVQQIEQQALQLQTAAEVAQDASGILDPDELIWRVVELAQDRFDLYYAGLFLIDETGRWAVLRAGTGDPGRTMVAQGHRLEVGGSSMIGEAVATGEPQIALDDGEEATRFDNPLLPLTRSEMALPLISRDNVLGALTIQSSQPAAFQEGDITVLRTMASQLANALDNARLFNEAQLALQDLEAVQRRYQQEAWSDYLKEGADLTYVTESPDEGNLEAWLESEIQAVLRQEEPTVLLEETAGGEEQGRSALVAPVKLRGTTIGALGVHDDTGTRQWRAEDRMLVELIAERMAQVAENLRLLDVTQGRAARERLVADVTGRVRSSMRLDSILRSAVRELGSALGTDRAYIVVGEDILRAGTDGGVEEMESERGGERDVE